MMDGESIRNLRRRLGITQQELAEALNVDQGTVSRWERNKDSPRPARMVGLRDLIRKDDERRAMRRSLALVRHNLLPATLQDPQLRMAEASALAARHYARRGLDIQQLYGVSAKRHLDAGGLPELFDFIQQSGILTGDAMIFRFVINACGRGHFTTWEPMFEDGEVAGFLSYTTGYFRFPDNHDVSLERVDVLPACGTERPVVLFEGARASLIDPIPALPDSPRG